jgi:hypothetical protein
MNLPGYDQWKLMTPDEEQDRQDRKGKPAMEFLPRKWTIGTCDCCEARNIPLRQVWTCGLETWGCGACTGTDEDNA